MRAAPATRAYLAQQRTLRALTYRDVMAVWGLLEFGSLDASFPRFAAAVGSVVVTRRQLSEALARDYLVALRRAAGVTGPAPTPGPGPLEVAAFFEVLRSATLVSVKKAMVAGRPVEVASRNALVNTLGVADKAVHQAGRDAIRASTAADDRARGWTRVTSGGCDWCRGMTGPVLLGSVEMAAHAHCGCTPQPVYS